MNKDDRHVNHDDYWKFLGEVWEGGGHLLSKRSIIVVRIGGKATRKQLFEGVRTTLKQGLGNSGLKVRERHQHSNIILKRRTNAFRPGTSNDRREFDFMFDVQ